jgi:hypothetical protein
MSPRQRNSGSVLRIQVFTLTQLLSLQLLFIAYQEQLILVHSGKQLGRFVKRYADLKKQPGGELKLMQTHLGIFAKANTNSQLVRPFYTYI